MATPSPNVSTPTDDVAGMADLQREIVQYTEMIREQDAKIDHFRELLQITDDTNAALRHQRDALIDTVGILASLLRLDRG